MVPVYENSAFMLNINEEGNIKLRYVSIFSLNLYSRIAVSKFNDLQFQDYNQAILSPSSFYNPIKNNDALLIPISFQFCESERSCMVIIQVCQEMHVVLSIPIVLTKKRLERYPDSGLYQFNCHQVGNNMVFNRNCLFRGVSNNSGLRNGYNWEINIDGNGGALKIYNMKTEKVRYALEMHGESSTDKPRFAFQRSDETIFADDELLSIEKFQLVAVNLESLTIRLLLHNPSAVAILRAYKCLVPMKREMNVYFGQSNLNDCVWHEIPVEITGSTIRIKNLDKLNANTTYLRVDFGESLAMNEYFRSVLTIMIRIDKILDGPLDNIRSANMFQAYTTFTQNHAVRGFLNPYLYLTLNAPQIEAIVKTHRFLQTSLFEAYNHLPGSTLILPKPMNSQNSETSAVINNPILNPEVNYNLILEEVFKVIEDGAHSFPKHSKIEKAKGPPSETQVSRTEHRTIQSSKVRKVRRKYWNRARH
jgi:hypothetical protein